MRNKLVAIILLACAEVLAAAAQKQTFSNHYFVNTPGGLNVRSGPAATAAVAFTLPDGELVEYRGDFREDTVGGRRGWWLKIRRLEREGFVFSAFLADAWVDNDPRNCGALLPALTSYNRKSGSGVLPFRAGAVGELTDGEYMLAAGRLVITAVIPPAAYCRYEFGGPLATAATLQRLKAAPLVYLHFRREAYRSTDRKPEGIDVLLQARILRLTTAP